MAREHLNQTLSELHDELSRTSQIDADDRAALLETMREIGELLKQENATPEITLRDRVGSEIDRFEGSHPQFAVLLARISESLANLGI